MKLISFFLTALIAAPAFAQNNEASCVVKINGTIRYDFTVASREGSNVTIGDFDGYRVFLHHNASQKYSLEIYDAENTVRTYSDTVFRNVGDDVTSTVWKREILVEATCTLHK